MIEDSAQRLAESLAAPQQPVSARWRWGTVASVGGMGTMDVEVGGTVLHGVRAARHVMGAKPGDRVRVMHCGTEAMVDAVRATGPEPGVRDLLRFEVLWSDARAISEGSLVEFSAPIPPQPGYVCRGAIQAWASGSGNVLVGAPWRTSADNRIRSKVRANVASNVSIGWLLMYVIE